MVLLLERAVKTYLKRNVVGLQLGRVYQHLVLLRQAAEGVDVDHSGTERNFFSTTQSSSARTSVAGNPLGARSV